MTAPEIVIDWTVLPSKEAFYESVLPQLDAPDWHGYNLDALWDSVGVGQVNGIEPPYRIVVRGISDVPEDLADFARRVVMVLLDAAMVRKGIEVTFGEGEGGA
jgi:RNAse (barnase) inhibitor barstar